MGIVRPLTVLVVEDDEDTRCNLRDILDLDGHTVETASTMAEALAHRTLPAAEVILLDRRLPDGTAEELLPRLHEAAPEAEVIIITGHAGLDSAIAVMQQGATDYLLKPINPDALRASLRRLAERRAMARRLVQSERLAAIGQTVTAISHEARNELHGLQLGLEALPRVLDDRERALKLIERLQTVPQRLERLFDDIRAFAAPLQLERVVCSVSDIWQKAWQSLEPSWQTRDVDFSEQVDQSPADLPVDVFRLEQVFRNLFENSLAACTDPVTISIVCESVEAGARPAVRISVRDTGPGLTPEQRRHVFEAFFTTKRSGTGLGMAIVRRIVEAHGGTISVAESSAPGAEFVILLPGGSGR